MVHLFVISRQLCKSGKFDTRQIQQILVVSDTGNTLSIVFELARKTPKNQAFLNLIIIE